VVNPINDKLKRRNMFFIVCFLYIKKVCKITMANSSKYR
jgi:hypothetical protein